MMARLLPLHAADLAVSPMSKELSGTFIRLCMMERESAPASLPELEARFSEAERSVPQIALLLGRIRVAHQSAPGLRFTPEAILLAGLLSNVPGGLVAWAYELVEVAREQPCSINRLAELFPWGFPTKEAMESYWDRQKVGGGNRLDRAETWLP